MVGAQLMGLPLAVPWTPRPSSGLNKGFRMKNIIHCSAVRPPPNWAVSVCDFLETAIFSSDPSFQNPAGPSPYLSDMFEPVQEMAPTTHLHITGTIPAVDLLQECLNGEFMRIGPNPRFMPRGGYHWVDGDGMIHGLRLKNGNATYAARYVQTHRFQDEERYGAPKFLRVGDLKGMKGIYCLVLEALRRVSGVMYTGSFAGNANTSLVYHNNKLLALQEVSKPYTIKVLEDGDVQTVGLEDFEKKLHTSFGAHPKIDPETGEMFTIGHSLSWKAPRMVYHIVSKEGVLREPSVPISRSSVMHDFAITKNYAIFMDLPFGLNLLNMAKGEFGIQFQPTKESRLGVLPRYAVDDSEIRWFTIPTCFIFHTLNAWEEEDEVVLICCQMDDIEVEHMQVDFDEKDPSRSPKLYEYRLNLQTGVVKQRQLSNLLVELPRINADYTGRKLRYAYCFTGDEHFTGVAKFDFTKERPSVAAAESSNVVNDLKAEGNLAGLYVHGPNRIGGDSVYVPRHPGNAMADEDDGYLITYVHDKTTGKSEAVIIDAKTMGPEPVAVVELPRRLPHGFHAHFLTQEQLEQQLE